MAESSKLSQGDEGSKSLLVGVIAEMLWDWEGSGESYAGFAERLLARILKGSGEKVAEGVHLCSQGPEVARSF